MDTVTQIWNAISPWLAGLTVSGVVIFIIRTGLLLIKNQKTTSISAIKAIEDKLMSLSVNKDVRLSLEQCSLRELKKIKDALGLQLAKAVDEFIGDIATIKDTVQVIAGALANFKAIPSEQVANLNAVLGLASPATIIELKPIEINDLPAAINAPAAVTEEAKYNPFE